MLTRKASFLGLTSVFLAVFALGEAIANWSAPATWIPAKSRGGLTTMGDVTNPLPFIGLAPCRIVDTRGNGAPIQGGIFTGGSDVRSYVLAGICGIPASARAVSLNFTVTGPGQTAAGFLLAWPTGGAVPPVSNLNWDHVPAQVGNAAVVPTSASTSITVNVSAPTHVIIDVNGYYYDGSADLVAGEMFTLRGAVAGLSTGLLSIHNTESVSGARAGYFLADSTGFGSTGLAGFESAGSGVTAGVYGQASSSTGDSAGVSGVAVSTSGRVYGIRGQSNSQTFNNAAGVFGVAGSASADSSGFIGAGVRGESATGIGVLGLTSNNICCAVFGKLLNTAGTLIVAEGRLGYNGAAAYGVYASVGTIGCNGCTKLFVEPHPADPMKSIHYVSLEGNEAGTYFRGTARTVDGEAVITVPEDFRIVTDPEGLTVQLTPVGGQASMYVEDEDLNRIVVHSSRDVTFHYLVQGIRPDYKNFKPIVDGTDYMPQGPNEVMPAAWPEKVKRALISNGTYNADGTVNMETAERLGWAKAWRDREENARAAAAANAAAHGAGPAERR